MGIEFSKHLGRGLFGGEEDLLCKNWRETVWHLYTLGVLSLRKVLGPGEALKVDTGCIDGFHKMWTMILNFVVDIKNTVFGGEGLFFATLRGPVRFMCNPYHLVDWLVELSHHFLEEARTKVKAVFLVP